MDGDDPRLLLARRLRALREEHWLGLKITQPQLAKALGEGKPLSAALISSWESQTNPAVPSLPQLHAYATLFATRRSFGEDGLCLVSSQDMTPEERVTEQKLHQELLALRNRAMATPRPTDAPSQEGPGGRVRSDLLPSSLSRGPWFFPDGGKITIVCPQWPDDMLGRIPYTDMDDPDYIELLTYSELDSLVMSYGHLRAANPASQVEYFRSGLLPAQNYSSHLVSLGGAGWNVMTASLLRRLRLPVRQVTNWEEQGGQFFEVDGDAGTTQHHPVLERTGDREVLEDVALFARTVNPFNRDRTATICCGMYGRGTYGVVRALTDPEFSERNTRYLESRFGNSPSYCLVVRVTVDNNKTMTPDWTDDRTRLFEWSESANDR